MTAAPIYPEFPKEEYDLRWERARQMMAEAKLDALFITYPPNYMYFTGHRSEQMLNDRIRPYVFLLPLEGKPVCFVMGFEVGYVRMATWVEEVRIYQLMQHNGVFEEAFRELGLADKRIGCELGREQYLGLNFNDFMDLKSRLPQATFADASDILLRLRMVKSPAEVERCRAAAMTTSRALARAYEAVTPGMTNLDVARLVRRFASEEGGEKAANLAVASGYDFTKGKISMPTPRRLEVGDTLTVDTAWEVQGYLGDVARTAVIGRASPAQKDQYRWGMDLNRACYEAIRPGNLCEDVMKTCLRELEKSGVRTQAVGRIGHGVGSEGTEFPSLALGEKVEFVPGMVFACNPNFVKEFGFFNMEENLVVTETGYELLSPPFAPPELQVLG